MIASIKRYLITDMGIAHLLTQDRTWIEIAYAVSAYEAGELFEFPTLREARVFCKDMKLKGSAVQPIESVDVNWERPPLDDAANEIDWNRIKEITKEVLEKAASGGEKTFRKKAKKIGVSYEDFLAAAITQLIRQEIVGEEV